ncbi:MAG: hypothetical protein AAGA20_00265 [Planctomycetota bacterium]
MTLSPRILLAVAGACLAGFAAGWWVGRAETLSRTELRPELHGADRVLPSRRALVDRVSGGGGILTPIEQSRPGRRGGGDASAVDARIDEAALALQQRDRTASAEAAGPHAISGCVVDEAGAALEGVTVIAAPVLPSTYNYPKSTEAFESRRHRLPLEGALRRSADEWVERNDGSTRAVTNATGKFEIDGLAARAYRVTAQLEGYGFRASPRSTVNPGLDDIEEVLFEGTPSPSVVIDLVRASGAEPPPTTALIETLGGISSRMVWSADDPRLFMGHPQCEVRARADVQVTSGGSTVYLSVSDWVPVDGGERPPQRVTLELHPICVVAGRLLESDQSLFLQARLVAVPLAPGETFDPTVPARGVSTETYHATFDFRGLDPGRYAICVTDANGLPADFEIVEVSPGLTDVTLQRQPEDLSRFLRVDVLAPDGRLLEARDVTLRYRVPGGKAQWARTSTFEQPEGWVFLDLSRFDDFDYDDWPEGTEMWVTAESGAYPLASAPLVQGQREVQVQVDAPCELRVQLDGDFSGGGFGLRVLDGSGPLEDAKEYGSMTQFGGYAEQRIDASGLAVFRKLPQGPVVVLLDRRGRSRARGPEVARATAELAGRTHTLRIEVPETFELAARVTPPSPPRLLELQSLAGSSDWQSIEKRKTSQDGRVVFRSLIAGRYRIVDDDAPAEVEVTVPTAEVLIDLGLFRRALAVSIRDLDGKLTEWGFEAGDRIVRIDGDPVRGRDQLMNALHLGPVSATVDRSGELVTIDVPRWPREARTEGALGGRLTVDS